MLADMARIKLNWTELDRVWTGSVYQPFV